MDLEGDDRHIVVLSDIHLGARVPTVWYQADVHEAPLLQILRWVVEHAPHVRELVLLGDIVELWAYPADAVPPTFADIVAAHPAVLGPDGALAEVLDALDGAVTYVPGNHDMDVTADEVASIRSRSGRAVRLVEDLPYLPVPSVALAHGHHFTLFNAPSTTGPWAPLPLGYFVTRAVATGWARQLPGGQTVADLAGQGSPNGLPLDSLARVVSGSTARSVAASLVDFVVGATGVGLDLAIDLPDGSRATLEDARHVFADCWSDWSAAEGGGIIGQAGAARAALADFDGTGLGWFAQRLALEHGADLVVMGHTHAPIGGLEDGLVDYVNSGFDCPSTPDRQREHDPVQVTFAVVDLGEVTDDDPDPRPSACVWAVDDDGCHPIEAPTTRVVASPARDFSCYVILDNEDGSDAWELVEAEATHGHHVVAPPERIEPGAVARFWLQDQLGVTGSAGTVRYRRVGGGDQDVAAFAYSCPMVGTNAAEAPAAYATRVGGDERWHDERIAHWGHPFFLDAELPR